VYKLFKEFRPEPESDANEQPSSEIEQAAKDIERDVRQQEDTIKRGARKSKHIFRL